jgi:UDPglucose--hexose-1-phosphate uridylyltransferase
MQYNELRKDYLLNRWVVIAKERSRRPIDLAKPHPEATKSTACPLCVGNENMTPPATMFYQKDNSQIKRGQDPLSGERPKNWLVRSIPNLYPAFTPPQQPQDTEEILKSENFGHAIGNHEVLVESTNHSDSPADTDVTQLELVIKAYIDRFMELSSKPYIKYVSIFRNFGIEAGASLSHAHSQIIATPILPRTIEEEQQANKTFQQEHGRCKYCDIIEGERKGPRLILENNDFIAFTPYAAINPMEFWILPKKHAANIQSLMDNEISSLALALKKSLKALKDLLNDPPYNYGIHQSVNEDSYHWHLEVYPKLSTWAGFEKSTGIYINTVLPEAAAESLRKTIEA